MSSKRMRIELDLKGDKKLIAALGRLGVGVNRLLVRAAQAGGGVIRKDANRRAPGPHVETEISSPRMDRVRVDVGPDRDHWYYGIFETGATPHTIRPKTRKMLRFQGEGGDEVFARAVQHPGMPARPFLRPALDERKDQAVDAVGDVLRSVLK